MAARKPAVLEAAETVKVPTAYGDIEVPFNDYSPPRAADFYRMLAESDEANRENAGWVMSPATHDETIRRIKEDIFDQTGRRSAILTLPVYYAEIEHNRVLLVFRP